MYTDTPMDFNKPVSFSNQFPVESSFMGSFKNQFYPGCSPRTLLGPLDIPDLKQQLVSSMESQHGSLLRMISGITPTAHDSSMCRDYTCCGIHLSDLHALVEHFEEHHVVVMDSPSLQPVMAGLNINALVAAGPSTVPVLEGDSLVDPQIDTMDPMELDVDIDDSQSSSGSGSHSGASTPSPPLTPVLPFDTTAIRRPSSTFASIPLISGGGSASTSPRLETAFNRYAEYTEFSAMLPGTITSSEHTVNPDRTSLQHSRQSSKSKACLPPALLSSSNTPQTSRAPSPSTPTSTAPSVGDGPSRQGSISSVSSSGLSRPASSLLLAKPFRCPKPGCNKSYKQANGLKYHLQHGSCNFAPRDESIDCLSEKEAEARLKPYQCQVPPCTRRYKNMNGLRYHYQHSGAHGAIGLALLASGQHEHVHSSQPHNNDLSVHAQYQVKRSRPSSLAGSANSSARSSPAPSRTSTPLSTPALTQSQAHANGFSFFQQQPVQQFQHHPHPHQQQTMMADVSMMN